MFKRRLAIGAEPHGERTHVRVWAPATPRVSVVVERGATTILEPEASGYFSGWAPMTTGARYWFALEGADRLFPDPASRFQPDGPHGPSEVIDPSSFAWTDSEWRGASLDGQVLYEMHVGTFTAEGTFGAAARQLDELARIGITMIELMPVADFNGQFGWGYDGVDLFAPTRLYGRPDDLRQFVDRAHRAGIAVILDVVYNHFGPSGNYLRQFSPAYFTDRYENEWGDAINFDGPDSPPVREFFETNAGYWIDEFRLDGLRLDATQQIFDSSPQHILASIGQRARDAAGRRGIVLVAENEPQDTDLVRPIEEGGRGLNALWNDDFHHSAAVATTGRREAYYTDTYGVAQEFVSAAKYGYLYQGQYYSWQRKTRGKPSWGLRPAQFITYLQNHDQIANSAAGLRGHQLTSPGRWRAITALLLLMPSTPMLFQGEEFCASAPFLYFADFDESLAAAIRTGRAEFLTQFPSIESFLRSAQLADPSQRETFERCRLDFSEREAHAAWYRLHEDLLRLRREDPVLSRQAADGIDGAVLSSHAFVLRFFGADHGDDRLLIVNLGGPVDENSYAEPLMAPPPGCAWELVWTTEDPRYGGTGMPYPWPLGRWCVAGGSAFLVRAGDRPQDEPAGVRRRTA